MSDRELLSRRGFLIDAARIAAAGLLIAELQLLSSCGRDESRTDSSFAHLTDAEARTLRAFAAQIIPACDGAPGARESGAAHFVDRAFGMPLYAQSTTVIRSGLADLDARARSALDRRDFASATGAEQIAIMRAIESTPFFANTRTLVIIGTFADPSYGGNRAGAGWALLDLEHRPTFSAPYGWYDAHAAPDSRAEPT